MCWVLTKKSGETPVTLGLKGLCWASKTHCLIFRMTVCITLGVHSLNSATKTLVLHHFQGSPLINTLAQSPSVAEKSWTQPWQTLILNYIQSHCSPLLVAGEASENWLISVSVVRTLDWNQHSVIADNRNAHWYIQPLCLLVY